MKELSIFIDESGDFGLNDKHSPYYLIAMVIHDQKVDISEKIKHLDREMVNLGYEKSVPIHTGPLIRREEPYREVSPNDRRAVLTKLFYFIIKTDIRYKVFIFNKNEYNDVNKLQNRIEKIILQFIGDNIEYFLDYEKYIIYYDNGQIELNTALHAALEKGLGKCDFRKVTPGEYRLFQVADFVCTMKLIEKKIAEGKQFTKSEKLIFHSQCDFKKDFLKKLKNKEFNHN